MNLFKAILTATHQTQIADYENSIEITVQICIHMVLVIDNCKNVN